jgi:hypothetical protein
VASTLEHVFVIAPAQVIPENPEVVPLATSRLHARA